MRRMIVMAGALVFSSGVAAAQQPTTSAPTAAAQPIAPLRHVHIGLIVPPSLHGISRTRVSDHVPDQLDQAAHFETPDQNENISVYMFRNVSGSVPIWFDRKSQQIAMRDIYGGAEPITMNPVFVPPGQQTANAMMMAYRTKSGPIRSTGLALIPLGEWYVALRYSSGSMEAEVLADRMRAVLSELEWPVIEQQAPAAAPVQPCTTALAYTGKAKQVEGKISSTFIASILAMPNMVKPVPADAAATPTVWCKDAAGISNSTVNAAVYRANESRDSYIIAVADSGRALEVSRDESSELLGGKMRWTVAFVNVASTSFFAPFNRLPTPDQTYKALEGGKLTSVVPTWGDTSTIQIIAP